MRSAARCQASPSEEDGCGGEWIFLIMLSICTIFAMYESVAQLRHNLYGDRFSNSPLEVGIYENDDESDAPPIYTTAA